MRGTLGGVGKEIPLGITLERVLKALREQLVEPEDGAAVERTARYVMRSPISLERMTWGEEGEVRYRRKGRHDGGPLHMQDPEETLHPAEFLALVIMHISAPHALELRQISSSQPRPHVSHLWQPHVERIEIPIP